MTDKVSVSFPREPDSVPAARSLLTHFEGRVPAARLYDATLCLSELVTNAIQHPDAAPTEQLEVEMVLGDDALRIEVVDPGAGFQPGPPTEGSERGWGLFIVDQLATRWGTLPGDRTAIWFEVERGDPRGDAEAAAMQRARQEDGSGRRGEVANMVARLRARPAIQ